MTQLQLLDDPDAPPEARTPIRMEASAVISPDELYRYELRRVWDRSKPLLCYVMLNPSTADASADDNTIRKCIGFARLLGCGGIVVVNLFAWRTKSPAVLSGLVQEPGYTVSLIGEENKAHLLRAVREADMTIAAWGVHGTLNSRGLVVYNLLYDLGPVYALGTTDDGYPRHPLYLKYESRPELWVPRDGLRMHRPTRVGRWQTEDPCTTYVGRGSKWGNPYVLPGKAKRSRCAVRETDDPIGAYEAYLQAQPHLMRDLPSLKGHVLGCFCVSLEAPVVSGPDRCHAQVLARLADRMVMEETRP